MFQTWWYWTFDSGLQQCIETSVKCTIVRITSFVLKAVIFMCFWTACYRPDDVGLLAVASNNVVTLNKVNMISIFSESLNTVLYNFETVHVFTESFVILHFCHFYLCFIRIRMCLTLRRRWSSLQEITWNRNWHLVRSAPSMSTNVCFTCTQTRSSIYCFDIYQICVMCYSMSGKMVWFVIFRDLIFTASPQYHFIDMENVPWYF